MKFETYGSKGHLQQIAEVTMKLVQRKSGYKVIGSTNQMQRDLDKQGLTR